MSERQAKWRWDKETSKLYQHPEYRKNRERVVQRDFGYCVRCWVLYERMSFDVECDHYRHIKSGEEPDHSMSNLWLLCKSKCHPIKTAREANGLADLAKPFGNERDADGWFVNINWRSIIAQRNSEYGIKY